MNNTLMKVLALYLPVQLLIPKKKLTSKSTDRLKHCLSPSMFSDSSTDDEALSGNLSLIMLILLQAILLHNAYVVEAMTFGSQYCKKMKKVKTNQNSNQQPSTSSLD
ncbi:Uncharacterized protein APZ42_006528, partial [Daphnia magna]